MRELQHIEADLKAAFQIQDPLVEEFNQRLHAQTLTTAEYDDLKGRVDSARTNVQRLLKERNRARAARRAHSTPNQIQDAIDLLKHAGFTVVEGRPE